MTICLAVICGILKEKLCSPMNKLLAVKLVKDLVETFNDHFLSLLQKSPLLGTMEKIAQFRAGSQAEDRGKEYFHFEGQASILIIDPYIKKPRT